MDIQLYATILLIFRIISSFFIGLVIYRQLTLFRIKLIPKISKYRQVLFAIAAVIMATNIPPIVIDILTMTEDIRRSTNTVNGVGLVYSMTWVLGYTLLSFFIWLLYKISADADDKYVESEHLLINDETKTQ